LLQKIIQPFKLSRVSLDVLLPLVITPATLIDLLRKRPVRHITRAEELRPSCTANSWWQTFSQLLFETLFAATSLAPQPRKNTKWITPAFTNFKFVG
jgi:hypothetical protein